MLDIVEPKRKCGRPPKVDEAKFRELWAAGAPDEVLMREFGLKSRTAIRYNRKKFGLPRRPGGGFARIRVMRQLAAVCAERLRSGDRANDLKRAGFGARQIKLAKELLKKSAPAV